MSVWLPNLKMLAKDNIVSLEQVLVSAIMGLTKGDIFPNVIKDLYVGTTNLLPEEWAPVPNWSGLPQPQGATKRTKSRVEFKARPVVIKGVDLVVTPEDDDWWKDVFPARAKKDLSIRRIRWRDVYELAVKSVGIGRARFLVNQVAGLDYIFSQNLVLACVLMGPIWTSNWLSRGTFSFEADDMITDFKLVSDHIKKFGLGGKDKDSWHHYVECGNLYGYKNHFEGDGFDILKEARELAEAGTTNRRAPEGGDWMTYFRKSVSRTLDAPVPKVEYLSFKEFVHRPDLWETGGSSSTGKLEWSMGEEAGSFKVRKNLLADVMDLDELYERCLATDAQVNRSLEKNELSKVRVAVSSDIETYLKMSWIMYLTGHWYLGWGGSTIEESTPVQYERMAEMLEKSKTYTSLPFDYKGFDHQPQTEEVVCLSDYATSKARVNVPLRGMSEFDAIAANVRRGYSNSTLATTTSVKQADGKSAQVTETVKVTGGVMSGLRFTTFLGNGWNTVMCQAAQEYYEVTFSRKLDMPRWIRGDDSAIYTRNYFLALLVRQCLQTVGAEGNNAKFGIHRHATEFLRVWYEDECLGYPVRMIPNICQRKPWSSEPLDVSAQWTVFRSVFDTLKRRGCDPERIEALWEILTVRFATKNKISPTVFSTPRVLGGMGVTAFTGAEVTGPVPQPAKERIQFQNVTEFRTKGWLNRSEDLRLPITNEAANQLADEDRMSKVVGDDIQAFTAAMRPKYRRMLQSAKTRTVSLEYNNLTVIYAANRAQEPQVWNPKWLKSRLESISDLLTRVDFGRFTHLKNTYDIIRRLRPDYTVRDTFKHIDSTHDTSTFLVWRGLITKLSHAAAKDWLFGDCFGAQSTGRNGMFDSLVQKYVTYAISQTWNFGSFKRNSNYLARTVSLATRSVSLALSVMLPVKKLDRW